MNSSPNKFCRAFAVLLPYGPTPVMASVRPFSALRPRPELASRICELPYDVMSSEEARALAADNPLSFLRISKPEIECPPGTDPHGAQVYARGRENLLRWIQEGALWEDDRPHLYVYRQKMGQHQQAGFVALASCDEYVGGQIRKHELTRPDKEDDRTRHIESLSAQTGPALLLYRAVPTLNRIVERVMQSAPDVDFVAPDEVRHTAWSVGDAETIALVEDEFARVPCLYIADGHHRTAAAARVHEARGGAGGSGGLLAGIFPHDQLQVLAYHRVLLDLAGRTPAQLLTELELCFAIEKATDGQPTRKHELGLFLAHQWYHLTFRPERTGSADPVETLDATLLQRLVLAPLFGIDDPRTSERIQFVGGIRGVGELERMVRGGAAACAFALYPTRIEDLLAIADGGGIMPPKSTWFEPKLRDGMFSYRLG
jgi:uncharacterized protein (DUF1015 family)